MCRITDLRAHKNQKILQIAPHICLNERAAGGFKPPAAKLSYFKKISYSARKIIAHELFSAALFDDAALY